MSIPSSGGSSVTSEQSHAADSSVHYNIPELQSTPGRSKAHSQPSSQTNGQHGLPLPCHQQQLSAEESEEYESEEEEASPPRWQGIEAIFEAYQEYAEGELFVVCDGTAGSFV